MAVLPQTWGIPMVHLIARYDGRFAGAAAVRWANEGTPEGFPAWMWVAPHLRRRGIGRALLDAVTKRVEGETPGLWSVAPLAPHDFGSRFLSASEFTPRRREYRFRAALAQAREAIGPIAAQARRRGALAQVELAPLAPDQVEAAAWLLSKALGGGPSGVAGGLLTRIMNPELAAQDASRVALFDGEVVGLVLCRRTPGGAFIDSMAVAEPWRRSPLTLVMLTDRLEAALAEGRHFLRFPCLETSRETLSLARRIGAKVEQESARYYRAL